MRSVSLAHPKLTDRKWIAILPPLNLPCVGPRPVNFEVTGLKPHLAFSHFLVLENTLKQPSFDGELMASFLLFAIMPHRVNCDGWLGSPSFHLRETRPPGVHSRSKPSATWTSRMSLVRGAASSAVLRTDFAARRNFAQLIDSPRLGTSRWKTYRFLPDLVRT